jgi:hypothetical protein
MVIVSGDEFHRECHGTSSGGGGRSVDVAAKNREVCGKCGQGVAEADKVVVAGREFHRACHGATIERNPVSSNIDQRNLERCGGCGEVIPNDYDSASLIIEGGAKFHRQCSRSSNVNHRLESQARSANIRNEEVCPRCNQLIGPEVSSIDKIVAQGKEWHRDCYFQQ